ncbi:beta-mannosidase [Leptopilina heterotoma]|uniref:beta-mannosidase n=1 Tax=Leptopilina heterotoma TaxID=63436 RepID=UPI001CA880BC|nr:beta-mannosidase [Leptopilina heterotoma]
MLKNVCFLVLIVLASQIESLLLHDGWIGVIKSKEQSFPATVPGGIYTDLEKAQIIPKNFKGSNDVKNRWVVNETVIYFTNFEVTEEFLKAPKIALIFHGLDTFSTIFLNDEYIGTSDNMFVKYNFNVKKHLKKEVNSTNKLEVHFASPLKISEMFYDKQKLNYEVVPKCTPEKYNGECHVNHIRKMQASFSWDWGPAFPSIGIWKDVELIPVTDAYVTEITADVVKRNSHWEINVGVFFDTLSYERDFTFNGVLQSVLELDDGKSITNSTEFSLSVKWKYSNISLTLQVPLESVMLWWPNGYGDQKLYNLITYVQIVPYETKSMKKIGFRTIELIQDPLDEGLTFYFRVNNLPIFAKGSNYIPGSIFPELSTRRETILPLLTSAKEANMNILRVWGGGMYESNLFYELADELGILIWQDFMFACSMYPTNEDFLKSVSNEVSQNVIRLKHHASIALWAGNNENEIALYGNWYGTGNKQVYKDDYIKLYVEIIKNIVEKLDPTRSYVVSSPSNGLYSDHNGYLGTNPGSNLYGDVHYYNYLQNGWDMNHFPRARFSSEYGFQSWPSVETLISAAEYDEDLKIRSDFMQHRQHLQGGDEFMKLLIEKNFIIPESNNTRRDLEDFVYLSQINQAVSIQMETEFYRQGKSFLNANGEGYTRGALYWQLNDVWQAPSWSSIEFGGRWKMLHYFARDFFAPVIVSSRLSLARDLTIYIISDLHRPLKDLSLTLNIYKWTSIIPVSIQKFPNLSLNSDESKVVKKLWLDDFLKNNNCGILESVKTNCFLEILLENDAKDEIIGVNYVYPSPLKTISLPPANVKMEVNPKSLPGKMANYSDYEIELTSDNIALFVWLEMGSLKGRFSENGFHILKGKKKIILHAFEAMTPKEIMKHVYLKVLSDVYKP